MSLTLKATLAAAALSLLAFATPSFATTESEAAKLCQQNPQSCHTVWSDKDGSIFESGKTYINCPKKGKCSVM